MATVNSLQIGVVYWTPVDGLAGQTTRIFESLGHRVIHIPFNAPLPQKLDVVFAFGPFDSLAPLGKQLVACNPGQRPAFVWWLSEQFPNPALPEWLRYRGGLLRSQVERWAYQPSNQGQWQPLPWLRWVTSKAYRFRYYGDVHWLQRQGVLSLLITGSAWIGDFLRARGFDPCVPPPSYHPDWGEDLQLERDIPVVWLGKIATSRRRRLLNRVRADLAARGVEMLVIDGVERPYIFGRERTELLNRTKIMLNLLREPWDNNAMRFTLATHNKVLVVTEPTLPHTAYQPGRHIVASPVEQLADTICYYLAHQEERSQIVEQAFRFIRQYTREEIFAQILERAIANRTKLF